MLLILLRVQLEKFKENFHVSDFCENGGTVLEHMDDISYVVKDCTLDTAVGYIDDFCEGFKPTKLTIGKYLKLVEIFRGALCVISNIK